jgi:hypothetical protein
MIVNIENNNTDNVNYNLMRQHTHNAMYENQFYLFEQ